MKDLDTAIARAFKQEIITKNRSIERCKECTFLQINSHDFSCTNTQPSIETCQVLKVFNIH